MDGYIHDDGSGPTLGDLAGPYDSGFGNSGGDDLDGESGCCFVIAGVLIGLVLYWIF